jgi:CRP-like cAMP-binding protein/TolB-like protein
MANQKQQIIGKNPLFNGLKPELIAKVVASTTTKSVGPGELIYQKGDAADAVYGVLSGHVVLEVSTDEGKELVLETKDQNDIFGVVGVLDFGPRQESARATEKSELFRIQRRHFLAILQTSQELCFRVFSLLCAHVRDASENLEDTVFYSLHSRLAKRLLVLTADSRVGNNATLQITQSDLAGILGVNRQAVNRHLREFEKDGLIELGRQRIVLKDLQRLSKLASPVLTRTANVWNVSDAQQPDPMSFTFSRPAHADSMNETSTTEGLLAIDAAEYSKSLMMDVAETLRRIKKGLEVVEHAVEKYRCQTIWDTGDRVLARFQNASDALQAALAIREKTGSARAKNSDSLFRIGVHSGKVLAKKNRFHGNDVNTVIALTKLVGSGGIAISGAVRDSIQDPEAMDLVFLGQHELKNVAGTVPIYSIQDMSVFRMLAFRAETLVPRRFRPAITFMSILFMVALVWIAGNRFAGEDSTQPAARFSVAVLPFASNGEDNLDYIARGVPEGVRNSLSRVPAIRVVGRETSDYYRFNVADTDLISRLANDLDVTYVVDGYVRSDEGRTVVHSRLRNAVNGVEGWSGTFDGSEYDLYEIQSEIAAVVIDAMKVSTFGISDQPVVDPEAHAYYLKGLYFYNHRDRESSARAYAAFQQAVAIDPDYAAAWVAISQQYGRSGIFGELPREERHQLALAALNNAFAAEPGIPEAWCVLGWLKIQYEWDWDGAEAAFERASELNPASAQCAGARATLAWTLGQDAREIRLRKERVEMDPLNLAGLSALGQTYIRNDRPEEALELFQQIIDIHPDFPFIEEKFGRAHLSLGHAQEALAEFEKFASINHNTLQIADAHVALGNDSEARAVIQAFLANYSELSPFWSAAAFAWLGDNDRAFERLEFAYQQKDEFLHQILTTPYLEALADDPRYEAFLEKLGLLRAWETRKESDR